MVNNIINKPLILNAYTRIYYLAGIPKTLILLKPIPYVFILFIFFFLKTIQI